MSRSVGNTTLAYLGWSGFDLRFPGLPPVLFDPPDGATIPRDRDICLIITHGHPEHIAGAAAYLRTKARNGRAEVLASPGVCRALKRRSGNKQDVFYPCRPGQTHSVDKFTIDVFECRHMPLLPPEKGEGLRRLRQIASNPGLAAGILADVLRFPLPGPTLGFRLACAQSPSILFFGEGLHRRARRDKIAATGARLPGDILIAAVEPEDVEAMPDLVSATGALTVVPYEAHAPWRRGFGMPAADLDTLSSRLQRQGYDIVRTDCNAPVSLNCAGRPGR
jgi:hypothetical protein